MNDYSALADKLRGSWQTPIPGAVRLASQGANFRAFFDRVKVEVIEEAKRANVELRKRGLSTIERVFVPCFNGKLSITFATALLCTVDLDEAKGRIVSVILGPPNRNPIARNEFPLVREATPPRSGLQGTPGIKAFECRPGPIASAIVSELLETGIRMMQNHPDHVEGADALPATETAAFAEFWISLASLLRSYTAVHCLNCSRRPSIAANGETISVHHGAKWLRLERNNEIVTWTRENGSRGALVLTAHGQLRGPHGDEAMDLAAESWARELMHDHTTEPAQ